MAFDPVLPRARPRIRFDRHELAGAFGDLGTDLPLLLGMLQATDLSPTSVFVAFGLMQLATGLVYRLPMPVQPLKAVAALVIAQQLPAAQIHGAGLSIGLAMLLLSLTGGLDLLDRLIPRTVIRGIQFGLGLQLAGVALGKFVVADGAGGLLLALLAFGVAIALLANRRYPAALVVVAIGLLYAVLTKRAAPAPGTGWGPSWPGLPALGADDLLQGFVLLALPQIPLSLGNSILATRQMVADLFPDRELTVRRIGLTYSLMNLIAPWLGGVPVCHGSGGLAGHYAFGARTGGSVLLYGLAFLLVGLLGGQAAGWLSAAFPLPVLGVLLLFESLALLVLLRDLDDLRDLCIAVLVGLCAVHLPYGYLVGMVVGTTLVRLPGALQGFGEAPGLRRQD